METFVCNKAHTVDHPAHGLARVRRGAVVEADCPPEPAKYWIKGTRPTYDSMIDGPIDPSRPLPNRVLTHRDIYANQIKTEESP